jgi:hypothetical protein
MLKRNFLLSLLACLPLLSCQNAMDEYCRRPCYVVVNNAEHVDETLAAAMNNLTPGVFCLIRKTMSGGASQFSFSTNTGLSSTSLFTAKEQRMSLIFGLNNGVIVGYGNADSPATFYAYDYECPNCFDPDAIPVKSKPLTMDEKGRAKCQVCGRVYDMNNRGYIIEGETKNSLPLNRFPADTSGPHGVLIVQ